MTVSNHWLIQSNFKEHELEHMLILKVGSITVVDAGIKCAPAFSIKKRVKLENS